MSTYEDWKRTVQQSPARYGNEVLEVISWLNKCKADGDEQISEFAMEVEEILEPMTEEMREIKLRVLVLTIQWIVNMRGEDIFLYRDIDPILRILRVEPDDGTINSDEATNNI